jgi:thiamine-monophosphate kinase
MTPNQGAQVGDQGRRVGEIGEFGLIADIVRRLPGGAPVLVGPGDDAALIATPDSRVIATTDLLIEGRHFRLDWSSAYDIGRKAAAQNLADVMAMGAVPTALLIGLALPGELSEEWVLQLMDGLRDEGGMVGAAVAGGDISRCDLIVLGVTALGDLQGRPPVLRSGARPGDRVVLAGRVGWAEAGLELLRHNCREPAEVVAAHRRPQPPYRLGPVLAAAGATALCDVSDGLLQDVGHIAAASGVGVDLWTEALPVDEPLRVAARELGADPLRWVLTGGDDHPLVGCLPAGQDPPPGCRVIGAVVLGNGVTVDGRPWDGAGGYDHYS